MGARSGGFLTAEGIVTETADEARLLIQRDTTQSPWVLGIELTKGSKPVDRRLHPTCDTIF